MITWTFKKINSPARVIQWYDVRHTSKRTPHHITMATTPSGIVGFDNLFVTQHVLRWLLCWTLQEISSRHQGVQISVLVPQSERRCRTANHVVLVRLRTDQKTPSHDLGIQNNFNAPYHGKGEKDLGPGISGRPVVRCQEYPFAACVARILYMESCPNHYRREGSSSPCNGYHTHKGWSTRLSRTLTNAMISVR